MKQLLAWHKNCIFTKVYYLVPHSNKRANIRIHKTIVLQTEEQGMEGSEEMKTTA
jgi:hypothetical protein